MRDRLLALEERKADLERMAEPERMPRLHPKLAEVYRQKVEQLEESLNDPAIRPEAADTLRSLIDQSCCIPARDAERFGLTFMANLGRSWPSARVAEGRTAHLKKECGSQWLRGPATTETDIL